MNNKKQKIIGIVLLGVSVVVLGSNWLFYNELTLSQQENQSSNDRKVVMQEAENSQVPIVSNADKPVFTKEKIEKAPEEVVEAKPTSPELPKQLTALTSLGYELEVFLDEYDVGYLDTSYYPLDEQTEATLKEYAQSGELVLFDNTQSEEVLKSYGKSSADVVASFFGVGAPEKVVIGTSIELENGQFEYMVLPIAAQEGEDEIMLAEKVKLAIELIEEEKMRKAGEAALEDETQEVL